MDDIDIDEDDWIWKLQEIIYAAQPNLLTVEEAIEKAIEITMILDGVRDIDFSGDYENRGRRFGSSPVSPEYWNTLELKKEKS